MGDPWRVGGVGGAQRERAPAVGGHEGHADGRIRAGVATGHEPGERGGVGAQLDGGRGQEDLQGRVVRALAASIEPGLRPRARGDRDVGMVGELLADGQIGVHVETEAAQLPGGPDPREQQQTGALDRSRAQDDRGCPHVGVRTVRSGGDRRPDAAHARDPPVPDEQPRRHPADHPQVRSVECGPEVGQRGVHPHAVAHVERQPAHAVPAGPVVQVGHLGEPRVQAGPQEILADRVQVPAPGDRDGAAAAVARPAEVRVVLRADERAEQLGVGQPRPGVDVARGGPGEVPAVDGARPTDHPPAVQRPLAVAGQLRGVLPRLGVPGRDHGGVEQRRGQCRTCSGPASTRTTCRAGSCESRAASTHPADPPPTITTSAGSPVTWGMSPRPGSRGMGNRR